MQSVTVPKFQKAAVLRKPYGGLHSVEDDYPVQAPGRNEALVRLEASGICSGDLGPRDGGLPAPAEAVRPLVAGHEGIGYIVALGDDVKEFQIGNRVGMGWRRSTCRKCDFCERGRDNMCQSLVINGYVKDGTFQEYACLPVSDLIRIPATHHSATSLAPLLCSGGTALSSVRSAGVKANDWLCITGAAGGVGSLAVQYGKHLGCRVVAIDSEKKRHFCEALGAIFVGFEEQHLVVQRVRDITGGGPNATIVCSASAASYSQAAAWSGVGATIVGVGIAMINVHVGQMMENGLKIVAQRNGSRTDIADALKLTAEGILPVVQAISLSELDEALDDLKNGRVTGRRVISFGS